MAEFDISPDLLKYLTPHMILPVLDQLTKSQVYPEDFLLKQRFAVLQKTKQFAKINSFIAENGAKLNIPADIKATIAADQQAFEQQYAAATQAVIDIKQKLEEGQESVPADATFLKFIKDNAALGARELSMIQKTHIQTKFSITPSQLTAIANFAALSVDCGEYVNAAVAYLLYYLQVDGIVGGPHKLTREMLWKMVEASLLCSTLHTSIYEVFIKRLRESIDNESSQMTLAAQTQQRIYYLVWSLYVLITEPPSNVLAGERLTFSDMVQQSTTQSTSNGVNPQQSNEKLLNALLNTTPSLIRYLVIFTIISAKVPLSTSSPWLLKRTHFFRELTRILAVQFGSDISADPIIAFFQQALVQFDIPAAIQIANDVIPKVFAVDPFLQNITLQTDFYDACKALLVDTVLKLNTNMTEATLQAMLPLKFPYIDNTISLQNTVSAVKAEAAVEKPTEAVAEGAATEATPEAIVDDEDLITPTEQITVQNTNTVQYISPLLSKRDYHHVLLNNVNKIKANAFGGQPTTAAQNKKY